MDNIIKEIISTNQRYYNLNIQFGNFKDYSFHYYLNNQDYQNIIKKFTNFKTKNITEYSYLNFKKILFEDTNKTIFYKKDFVKCYLVNNTVNNNYSCNYYLIKEKKINKILPHEFSNVKEKIIIEKKKIKSTKSVYNNTEIIINFVELENNKYSINLDIDFDINNSKKISSHLNYLYKKMFNKCSFRLL